MFSGNCRPSRRGVRVRIPSPSPPCARVAPSPTCPCARVYRCRRLASTLVCCRGHLYRVNTQLQQLPTFQTPPLNQVQNRGDDDIDYHPHHHCHLHHRYDCDGDDCDNHGGPTDMLAPWGFLHHSPALLERVCVIIFSFSPLCNGEQVCVCVCTAKRGRA